MKSCLERQKETHIKCRKWLSSYYGKIPMDEYQLLQRAAETLTRNIRFSTGKDRYLWEPFRGIIPSPHGFNGVWNWDSAFHAVGVAHWDPSLAREQIQIIINAQLPNGLFPDVLFSNGKVVDTFGKPPVLAWAAMKVYDYEHDEEFLKNIYAALVKNEEFWCRERGGSQHGLFNYNADVSDELEHIKCARFESGWDNSVRWDNCIWNIWAIDLNCYMVLFYHALSRMAFLLGNPAEVGKYQEKAAGLTERIEKNLWDEEKQAYMDYDFVEGQFISAMTPASFMPLYIGIASVRHAEAMSKHGSDPNKFYPGWPTVSYDDPEFDPESYWRGRTWYNVAYFALKGLKQYGFDEAADAGRRMLLDWVLRDSAEIYENYNSKTGDPVGAPQFGWSAVFVIEFLLNWK